MADVFISYSRKDREFVHRLHEELQRLNRAPWMDTKHIPPTAEWLAEVYSAIEAANTFVFVIKSLQQPDARFARLSPDGKRLAVADGSVRILDVASATPVCPPIGIPFSHAKLPMAFSPDGASLVMTDGNARARVWDATRGRPAGPPLEHSNTIRHIAFSPSGELVLTASSDKTARLWHALSGVPLSPPLPHPDSVVHAAFSRDGCKLVTASGPMCFLWDLTTGERSSEEWVLLARLLACGQIDETGTVVALDDQEFYATWLKLRREGSG